MKSIASRPNRPPLRPRHDLGPAPRCL
jgi:hypothetical protein